MMKFPMSSRDGAPQIEKGRRAVLQLALPAFAALVARPRSAFAADWPSHTVTVIFPYGPGGGDVIARPVLEKVGDRLGQRFVIEDRPGAGGVLGTGEVARAEPDGYRMIISSLGSMILAPIFNGGPPPFDAVKSFTHIAFLGGPPAALVVSPSSPAKNLKDFVALSKSTKGGLDFGSPGRGSLAHLVGEMLARQSGAKLLHIPYKEAPRVLTDLAGGQISAAVLSLAGVAPLVKSGHVTMLAVATAERSKEFPDVPTFAESGYQDIVASTWFGLSAPSGLAPAIVAKVNAEARRALRQPDVRSLLERLGAVEQDMDADAFARFVAAEQDRWAPIARAIAAEQK